MVRKDDGRRLLRSREHPHILAAHQQPQLRLAPLQQARLVRHKLLAEVALVDQEQMLLALALHQRVLWQQPVRRSTQAPRNPFALGQRAMRRLARLTHRIGRLRGQVQHANYRFRHRAHNTPAQARNEALNAVRLGAHIRVLHNARDATQQSETEALQAGL